MKRKFKLPSILLALTLLTGLVPIRSYAEPKIVTVYSTKKGWSSEDSVLVKSVGTSNTTRLEIDDGKGESRTYFVEHAVLDLTHVNKIYISVELTHQGDHQYACGSGSVSSSIKNVGTQGGWIDVSNLTGTYSVGGMVSASAYEHAYGHKESYGVNFFEKLLGISVEMDYEAEETSAEEGTVFDFDDIALTNSRAYKTFKVPVNGLYKLEVWGGQGGNGGGTGGYSCGYREFTKGDTIYVCVGGQGASASSGGFASWMSLEEGSSIAAIGKTKFVDQGKGLIVAGGGGSRYPDYGWYRASDGYTYWVCRAFGGTGGGLTGSLGRQDYDRTNDEDRSVGTLATQTSGKVFGDRYGGGGDGLYSGDTGLSNAQGSYGSGGGSGYIGGVPALEFRGDKYSPTSQGGKNAGNGSAKITLIRYAFGLTVTPSSWTNQPMKLSWLDIGQTETSIYKDDELILVTSDFEMEISENGTYRAVPNNEATEDTIVVINYDILEPDIDGFEADTLSVQTAKVSVKATDK